MIVNTTELKAIIIISNVNYICSFIDEFLILKLILQPNPQYLDILHPLVQQTTDDKGLNKTFHQYYPDTEFLSIVTAWQTVYNN